MRATDPVFYLFGARGAIERVAAARGGWLVGALLVLSAGIARNYDHLDLLRNPEWWAGPFVASLVSVVVIFLWISWPLRLDKAGGYWRQAGMFVTLAWLTAPCAWIYGIPVEGMTDIVTATKWNIAFLVIVATWRVAIMVRAVSVLADVRWWRVLPLVLAPAAMEAMVAAQFAGMSLVGIMGGIRLPPHTQVLVEAARFTARVSFFLLIGCVIASCVIRGQARQPLYRRAGKWPRAALVVAAFPLLAWAAVAIPRHPQMANRHELERRILTGDLEGAVAFAARKEREDFPPYHDLPPKPGQFFPYELLELLPQDAPDWLRETWTENAVASVKAALPWVSEDPAAMFSHPVFGPVIERQAAELRARRDELDDADSHWLFFHDRHRKNMEDAAGESQ